ncbi:hypothetical protein FQA39_LY02124 [Lamprigera yunnana]|nr:hypothetical protein FQA39_LY02124 [Lamprigera yunnana]
MKIYAVVLACILAGAFAQEDKKEQMQKKWKIIQECGEKHNMKFAHFGDVMKALDTGSEQIQAVCHCVMKGMGHLGSNDEILYDEIKKQTCGLEPEKVAAFVDQCKSEKGATPAETSYKFTKCFVGHVSKAHQEKKQQKQQGAQLHLSLY